MELKLFIKDVLQQMDDLKSIQQKKNYLVEELEFELFITETGNGSVGVSVLGFGTAGSIENQNSQKVKIKLVPRNRRTIKNSNQI